MLPSISQAAPFSLIRNDMPIIHHLSQLLGLFHTITILCVLVIIVGMIRSVGATRTSTTTIGNTRTNDKMKKNICFFCSSGSSGNGSGSGSGGSTSSGSNRRAYSITSTSTSSTPQRLIGKYRIGSRIRIGYENGNGTRFYSSFSFSSSSSTKSSTNEQNNETNEFWKRINQPKTVMAPMVAQSDLPFRHLCRSYNTDLCYTQMIHSDNFVRSTSFQDAYLDVYKYSNIYDNIENIRLSPSGWKALEGLDWNDCIQRQESMINYYSDEIIASEEQWMDFVQQMASLSSSPSSRTSPKSSTPPEYWGKYCESLSEETNANKSPSPLIVQLAGHDPSTVSQAAQIILSRTNSLIDDGYNSVSGIDINCGCPQAIARKGRYGAFLMEESVDIVCDVLKQLRKDVPSHIGVSAKIRIPRGIEMSGTRTGVLDKKSMGALELQSRIHKLIDSGVDIITIHGRTIDENKTKVRGCNWDAIAYAVQIARDYTRGTGHCPAIIANGGIEFTSDVQQCLDYTGADAVMSSESLLENPGLFSSWDDFVVDDDSGLAKHDVQRMHPRTAFDKQLQYCHELLDLCVRFPPLPGSLGKGGGSFNCIRGHLFKMLYRYLEEHPDLRTLLGHSSKTCRIQQARDILNELQRRYGDLTDDQWVELKSSNVIKASWYRRHREANANIRARGQRVTVAEASEQNNISIEERKRLMKERINLLKKQNGKKVTVTQ